MAETKYGKYIITELAPGLKVPDFRAELVERMTHFLWIGDKLINNSLYMECAWVWKKSDSPGLPPRGGVK